MTGYFGGLLLLLAVVIAGSASALAPLLSLT